MKNPNRGCLIFLGIFSCLILILILIPNYYERTGCRYSLFQSNIEVLFPDSTFTNNGGNTWECIYVTFHRNDCTYVFPVSKYSAVVREYVTEEVTGDRSNPFMLIVQKPAEKIFEANGSNFFVSIPAEEKFVEAYPYCQYWIIKFDTDEVYGPFEQEEYLRKRKELGVGEELKLKFEREQK